ncbi:hypothetical protein SAMN05421880_1292 [Nitrosomonas nitrosa]|uniref:Uncharacterized protein n=1 Tax=Nitrosomonas nitrosa TaxID=52442 RepID=A0A1I4T3X3_9PROT|nr:hypothetical protein [Nitrosomonas nitrosa]SFM71369.1 hypothetical protein SAMN05421880_1292 [Nitrosomonas nitrosa]
MAWTSGTATNAADLFNKLITFLTADATLVAGGEAWTLLRRDTFILDAKRDLVELRGPGSSAGDAIYVQLCLFADAAAPAYSLRVLGSQSWQSAVSISTPEGQPGSLLSGAGSIGIVPRMPVFNSAVSYWFVANGRRFIVVAKSSAYWGALYAGFVLPYGTPSQYPYPLFVGANTSRGDNYQSADLDIANSAFWRNDGEYGSYSAAILQPSGGWIGTNRFDTTYTGRTWPWAMSLETRKNSVGRYDLANLTQLPNGASPLLPAILYDCATSRPFNIWGELQGVFAVPGFGVAAGDTVTVAGKSHLVVQAATSTNAARFAAIQLT